MTENWKPYPCNVNGKLASIFVDLGLREVVPIPSKPWLLWTWVYFKSPRADGLSDSKEAPTLYKIEDSLNVNLARASQAIPCGRITTEGRREFYFYGETKNGFRHAVEAALTGFEGYRFDAGSLALCSGMQQPQQVSELCLSQTQRESWHSASPSLAFSLSSKVPSTIPSVNS